MRAMIYVECIVKCFQEDFGFLLAALPGVLHPDFSGQFSALPEAVWKCQHGFFIVHLHTNAISLILHSSCLRETMIPTTTLNTQCTPKSPTQIVPTGARLTTDRMLQLCLRKNWCRRIL